MIKKFKYIAIFLFLSSHAMGRGSGASNNSGIICCKKKTSLSGRETCSLYDLWEAHQPGVGNPFYKIEDLDSELSVSDLVQSKIELMEKIGGSEFDDYIDQIKENYALAQKKIKRLSDSPHGKALPWPKDFGPHYFMHNLEMTLRIFHNNCTIRGLAVWNDEDDSIVFDDKRYNRLTNKEKAGMWLHEIIYKTLRQHTETDYSSDTRIIVANLFKAGPVTQKDIFPWHIIFPGARGLR